MRRGTLPGPRRADRRYSSMGEILADLERRSQRLPLAAHAKTLPYILSRFATRNAILLLALAVIAGLQMWQVFINLGQAQSSAMGSRCRRQVDQAYAVFRDFETNRYHWLDLVAQTQAADPALHKVILSTNFPTWRTSITGCPGPLHLSRGGRRQSVCPDRCQRCRGGCERTSSVSPPSKERFVVPCQRCRPASLQGAEDPGHGYWQVNDKLYQISVVPWLRGHYVDGAFLVGRRVTLEDLKTLSQISFVNSERVFASLWPASSDAVLLRLASAAPGGADEEVQLHGERNLVRYVRLARDSSPRPAGVVVTVETGPHLEQLRKLQTSYVAEATGEPSCWAVPSSGYLLWRSESQSGRKADVPAGTHIRCDGQPQGEGPLASYDGSHAPFSLLAARGPGPGGHSRAGGRPSIHRNMAVSDRARGADADILEQLVQWIVRTSARIQEHAFTDRLQAEVYADWQDDGTGTRYNSTIFEARYRLLKYKKWIIDPGLYAQYTKSAITGQPGQCRGDSDSIHGT